MGDEYPKAMYRAGTQYEIWGYHVDYLVVSDEQEEIEAKREGWAETPIPPSPLDHDLNGAPGGSLPRRGRPPKVREEI